MSSLIKLDFILHYCLFHVDHVSFMTLKLTNLTSNN